MELPPADLCRVFDPEDVPFETTDDVEAIQAIVGQSRAVAAVEFGVLMGGNRHNIFAMGPSGTGKQSVVQHFLGQRAAQRPTPPDICYVHNFDNAHEPRLLLLPPGRGRQLARDMDQLMEEVRTALAGALEGEEYQARRHAIEDEFKEKPEKSLADIEQRAKDVGLTLLRTPMGMAFAPVREGEVLSEEDFKKLTEEEQQALQRRVEEFQDEARKTLRQIPKWDRERRARIRELNRDVTNLAVGHLIDELRATYAALPKVLEYLDAVAQDIVDHVHVFVQEESSLPAILSGAMGRQPDGQSSLRRFQVNVLVDRTDVEGAPVIQEDHPNYDNLIGRIEHIPQLGALVTDHTLIKPGALHRAHGGYLVIDANRLLRAPYAYEAFKRALHSRQLRIESLGQALSLVSTVSLQPEPLDLDIQVVLLGEPILYYLLCYYDADFRELFKVVADFDDRLSATEENRLAYARLIATIVRRHHCRPFDRSAVARIVQHGFRMAGDQQRVTARIELVEDLIREANTWAGQLGHDRVAATDVQQAIDAQIHRLDRLRERYQDEVTEGVIKIDTAGERVGQVNGLSVVTLGGFSFGHPSRITALVRVGEGEVVDIEREVELGGPIHSKGVLILEAFLGARYSRNKPLSLTGSLVFEQTYGGVEGDSASAAELFALLSAIARVPLRQALAVTGSVNQRGEIQAIGGVNEKVEGFFAICKRRGLTGDQGVIIPAANVKHLMLERDVVDAVAKGQFHLHAIDTVDDGLSLLSGLPAGQRDESGTYPEGCFNHFVEERLLEFAEERRAFKAAAEGEGEEPQG